MGCTFYRELPIQGSYIFVDTSICPHWSCKVLGLRDDQIQHMKLQPFSDITMLTHSYDGWEEEKERQWINILMMLFVVSGKKSLNYLLMLLLCNDKLNCHQDLHSYTLFLHTAGHLCPVMYLVLGSQNLEYKTAVPGTKKSTLKANAIAIGQIRRLIMQRFHSRKLLLSN